MARQIKELSSILDRMEVKSRSIRRLCVELSFVTNCLGQRNLRAIYDTRLSTTGTSYFVINTERFKSIWRQTLQAARAVCDQRRGLRL